jgi:hypothetical protein
VLARVRAGVPARVRAAVPVRVRAAVRVRVRAVVRVRAAVPALVRAVVPRRAVVLEPVLVAEPAVAPVRRGLVLRAVLARLERRAAMAAMA